ncbi:MAG: NAD-binding protein [Wenzhouxiangellaceae bacterium]|nr:NAD-binding protein [Wenzhouxiangellaceae bacterium]
MIDLKATPATESLLFLFFRRMRVPLVVLISAYAIATLGFTLVPGVDDEGNPWRMTLFEAFYVVSYTGSTIGFGEVPYEFTAAQRMWTIASIYLTVVAWLFSIGSIISLLQDPVYARALRQARLARSVRAMSQPFYLVCGYGDTGRMLTRALTARGHPVVLMEQKREKIETLAVEDLGASVTGFALDARMPEHLVSAGLRSRWCAGVLAVTGDDQANLKIAISARLLNHKVTVHARAGSREVAQNMRSFETDHVVSPVDEYCRRLRLALEQPDLYRLYHWMLSGPGAALPKHLELPRGPWIVCGFGRVGRAVWRTLTEAGIETRLIDPHPDREDRPDGTIRGTGTQAETLEEAGIGTAAGIVAATSDDADNLSILVTAESLNPDLYLAALENGLSSHDLFEAAEPDFVAQPSTVTAGTMLGRIASPLIGPFIDELLKAGNESARDLLACLLKHQDDRPPALTAGRISANRSPAVARAIERGEAVTVGMLLTDPRDRERRLPLEALLIKRGDENELCPPDDRELELGDRLLLGGRRGAARRVGSTLENDHSLDYVRTGIDHQRGWVWRWLQKNGAAPAPEGHGGEPRG